MNSFILARRLKSRCATIAGVGYPMGPVRQGDVSVVQVGWCDGRRFHVRVSPQPQPPCVALAPLPPGPIARLAPLLAKALDDLSGVRVCDVGGSEGSAVFAVQSGPDIFQVEIFEYTTAMQLAALRAELA